MRIVAGTAGGRRLKVPPGRRLRPTSERVREAVFSSLTSQELVAGARVIDLFAGTGALGIEALSRGAREATFVEADPAAVAAIRANLVGTGVPGGRVVVADALRFLGDLPSRSGTEPGADFDLAFVDPPYAFAAWTEVLDRLPAAVAVLESRRPVDPGPGWEVTRSARYGDTAVTVVRRTV